MIDQKLGAALLLATTLAGCVASQRFAPAQQSQAVPQGAPPPQAAPQAARGNLGGPYTRAKEDREFGQPLNGSE